MTATLDLPARLDPVDPFDTALRTRPTALVSSVASDSHTWNLVYLQLLVEELGYDVVNLGACVPDALLVRRAAELAPDLIAISSVNGHGYRDGLRVAPRVRAVTPAATTMVIGGKLGIDDRLTATQLLRLRRAGYDAVFPDGESCVTDFRSYVTDRRGTARTTGSVARSA